jgi:hypothetical protein
VDDRILTRIFQYQPEAYWFTSFLTRNDLHDPHQPPVALAIRGFCNHFGYHEQLRRGKCFTKIKPSHPEYLDGDCYRVVTKNKGIIYIKLEFFKQVSLVELDLL